MEDTSHYLDNLSAKLDNLLQSLSDGIEQIFNKYADKFCEIVEDTHDKEPQNKIFEHNLEETFIQQYDHRYSNVTHTKEKFYQQKRFEWQHHQYGYNYVCITATLFTLVSKLGVFEKFGLIRLQNYQKRGGRKKRKRLKCVLVKSEAFNWELTWQLIQ